MISYFVWGTSHPFLPAESDLGFLGVGFCLLGICLSHHRSPCASHPVTRTIVILITSLSYFQNRDMGQKRLRVANCRWCMVGWDRIAHPEYISYLQLSVPSSHVPSGAFSGLTMVRGLRSSHHRLTLTHISKLAGTYNPIIGACIILHTRRALVNALGALVVDGVLLLTMLIGLLRHAHRNSTGIWKLLYQQVTDKTFYSSCSGF